MSPTRIVILAVLFYFLYRLLTGKKKNDNDPAGENCTDAKPNGVDDVLMEDPVCHTFVPAKDATTLKRDGKTLYFCSDKCKSLFKKGAEK